MPPRFVRLDPDTVELLDRCIARAQEIAAEIDPRATDEAMRTRLASALIEASSHGERDEEKLVDFALQILPAYRESRFRRAGSAGAGARTPEAAG